MSFEYLLIGIVVADCGEDNAIGVERNSGHGSAFPEEPADQFADDMLGVRGGTAVAADVSAAGVREAFEQDFDAGGDGGLAGGFEFRD